MKKLNQFKNSTIILSMILTLTISNSFGQSKTCADLKGIWYLWVKGASEPTLINFNGCEWKESGNPMYNKKGTAIYSAKKKKYEIIGLSDDGSGQVYLTKGSDYYYISWLSDWFSPPKPLYLVLTRTKYRARHIADIYDRLNAGGK